MARRDEQEFLRKAIKDSVIAAERGFQPRGYQLDLADQALRVVRSGHNVGLTLPTGLGKTMVADLIARSWIDQHPDQTVLSVVPRRVLVHQHSRHALWLQPPVQVSSLTSADRRLLNRNLRDSQLVVTTPRLLGNAIRNDRIEEHFRGSSILMGQL